MEEVIPWETEKEVLISDLGQYEAETQHESETYEDCGDNFVLDKHHLEEISYYRRSVDVNFVG